MLEHAIERGREVAHPRRGRVVGVVREGLEHVLADQVLGAGHRGVEIGRRRRFDDEVGGEHQMRGVLRLVERTEALLVGAQRILEALALGHVARRAEPFDDLAPLVEDRHRAGVGPAQAAIGEPDAMLELEHALGADRLLDRGDHPRLIIGMDVGLEPAGARRLGVGEEAAPVELAHLAPVGAHPVHRRGARGEEGAEPLDILAQPALRQLARGALDQYRQHACRPPALVDDR